MKLFKNDWEKKQAAEAKFLKEQAKSLKIDQEHKKRQLDQDAERIQNERKVSEAQKELAKAQAQAILKEVRMKEEAAKPESVRLAEATAKADAKKREEEEKNWSNPDRVFLLEIPGTPEEIGKFISKGASLIETLANNPKLDIKYINVIEKKISEAQTILITKNESLALIAGNRIEQAKSTVQAAQQKLEELHNAKKKRRLIKYGAIALSVFLLWLFNSGIFDSKPPISKVVLGLNFENSCSFKLISLEVDDSNYGTNIIATFGNEGKNEIVSEAVEFSFVDDNDVYIGKATAYGINIPKDIKVKEELQSDFELTQHLRSGKNLTCKSVRCK